MGTKYVLDTSVVIKWFAPDKEKDLSFAKSVLSDIHKDTLEAFAPEFLLIELTNVLLTGKQTHYQVAIDCCNSLLHFPIKFIHFSYKQLHKATQLSHKYHITIYDGIFAAIAEDENCPLITADAKLARLLPSSLLLSHYKTSP